LGFSDESPPHQNSSPLFFLLFLLLGSGSGGQGAVAKARRGLRGSVRSLSFFLLFLSLTQNGRSAKQMSRLVFPPPPPSWRGVTITRGRTPSGRALGGLVTNRTNPAEFLFSLPSQMATPRRTELTFAALRATVGSSPPPLRRLIKEGKSRGSRAGSCVDVRRFLFFFPASGSGNCRRWIEYHSVSFFPLSPPLPSSQSEELRGAARTAAFNALHAIRGLCRRGSRTRGGPAVRSPFFFPSSPDVAISIDPTGA